MDLSDKEFSILPKARGMLVFGLALWALCLANTIRVIIDFQGAFMSQNLFMRFLALILLFVFFQLTALFLFSPFRYRVIERGVRIESLLRKRVIKFDDVDAVVIDVPPRQRTPVERVVLFVGTKAFFLVGLANDYELLRDYVLDSVDPAIVEDRRKQTEGDPNDAS